jgi:hypothetical protein
MCLDYRYLEASMSFQDYLDAAEAQQGGGGTLQEIAWRGYATHYVEWLQPWLDVFEDDLFIGFFEHLRDDPAAFCDEVCAWLGVESIRHHAPTFEVENPTIQPRSPTLHRWVRVANRFARPILDRRYNLKRQLRYVYNALNAERDAVHGPTVAQRARLEAFFAPGVERLREELHCRRPALVLPTWLDAAATDTAATPPAAAFRSRPVASEP